MCNVPMYMCMYMCTCMSWASRPKEDDENQPEQLWKGVPKGDRYVYIYIYISTLRDVSLDRCLQGLGPKIPGLGTIGDMERCPQGRSEPLEPIRG